MKKVIVPFLLIMLFGALAGAASAEDFFAEREYIRIFTNDITDRSVIANLGFAIDYVDLDANWMAAWVPREQLAKIQSLGFAVEVMDTKGTFPNTHDAYHDYQEQNQVLRELATAKPEITDLFSIGQSVLGQEIWCLKISDNPLQDEVEEGAMVLVAMHHAREILTPEMALHAATQLVEGYGLDEEVTAYVDNREIFVLPNLNPDGGEFDHHDGRFHMWRKNRRVNEGSQCRGVDLNRNYGYEWGGPGASARPCDDTFRGASAFSEPESAAFRDFIYAHENITTLVTLHTYSKLVLYPWGYKRGGIEDRIEFLTHKTMAEYMGGIMGYRPTQASNLYPTNGDTTDWSYGELGITSFTWEMAPSRLNPAGFYPLPSTLEEELPKGWNALRIMFAFSRVPSLILATDPWKFAATIGDDAVTIQWATLLETNPKGYVLLRAEVNKGEFAPLHDGLIEPNQGEYSFVDDTVEAGVTYEYLLQFKGTNDNDVEFDPISVAVPGDTTDDDTTDDDDDTADDDASDDDDDTDIVDGDGDDDDDNDDGCGC